MRCGTWGDCDYRERYVGKEAKTIVSIDGKGALSKVLLEGTDIVSRGEHRGKWNVKEMKGLKASAGKIAFSCDAGKVAIDLGDQAVKWLEALTNPRTRAQKLGVENGSTVCVLGESKGEDLSDVEEVSGKPLSKRMSASADVVLLFARRTAGLERLNAVAEGMQAACSVWVMWPKGVKEFGHEQVAAAGKAAGLSQTRSIGFSEVFSGLRFVRRKGK